MIPQRIRNLVDIDRVASSNIPLMYDALIEIGLIKTASHFYSQSHTHWGYCHVAALLIGIKGQPYAYAALLRGIRSSHYEEIQEEIKAYDDSATHTCSK